VPQCARTAASLPRLSGVVSRADRSAVPYVARRYVVALAVALIGLVASIIVPKVVNSINAANAKADNAKSAVAFAQLKVPSNFRPLPASNINCVPGLLCYRVSEPTTAISEPTLAAILRSTGAVFDTGSSYCSTFALARSGRAKTCTVYARLDGLYIYALLRGFDPRAPRRGLSGSVVWITPPFTPHT
jgi:hypothetical protein